MSRKEIQENNYIFRRFLDGRPMNFGNLHEWLDKNFVYQLNANYEWFALWRIVTDLRLIESGMTTVSKFVFQMNKWFPDAPHPCKASEINRYKRGYLGNNPFEKWSEHDFRMSLFERKHCKQCQSGYERLHHLCNDIMIGLSQLELKE